MTLLEGKIALVTGSSQGIGASIALALAGAGADVCVNYYRSEVAGHEVADSIRALGRRAIAVGADVRDAAQVSAMVDRCVEELGGLDVIVNNALHDYRFDPAANPRFEQMEWGQFQDQIDGTVAGAAHVIQAALPTLRERGGGSVINILTNLITNPVGPVPRLHHGEVGHDRLPRNLAAELGPDQIRVNMLAGGLIMTTRPSSPPARTSRRSCARARRCDGSVSPRTSRASSSPSPAISPGHRPVHRRRRRPDALRQRGAPRPAALAELHEPFVPRRLRRAAHERVGMERSSR